MKTQLFIIIGAILTASVCYGHTWVCQWSPKGWTSSLGPHLNHGHIADDQWCGEVFLLDTQAREKPDEYKKVLRAQWIAEVLDEEKADKRLPGSGGFWESLASEQRRVIVGKHASDSNSEPEPKSDVKPDVKIPVGDQKIVVSKEGIFTIPALAYVDSGKILLMKSHDKGMQLHVPRQGKELSQFRYTVNLQKEGEYQLSAKVVTLHNAVKLMLSVNNSPPLEMSIPYTLGKWDICKPVVLELKKGANTLDFSGYARSNGLSIKQFTLSPM